MNNVSKDVYVQEFRAVFTPYLEEKKLKKCSWPLAAGCSVPSPGLGAASLKDLALHTYFFFSSKTFYNKVFIFIKTRNAEP